MKPKREDKFYSPTEVGTLIESFRNDISIIAERTGTLCTDVTFLKSEVKEIKNRLITVEDVIRITIPSIHTRFSALESKIH